MEAMFFSNGNTAFCKNGEQVPELQKSWLLLYVDFLIKKKINPLDVKFQMPGGQYATIIKTGDSWNWKF